MLRFAAFRRRLSDRGWTPELLSAIAFGMIGPLAGALMDTHRSRVYGAAIGITILLWVLAVIWAETGEQMALPVAPPPSPNRTDALTETAPASAFADLEPAGAKQNAAPPKPAEAPIQITGTVEGPVIISQNQSGGQVAHTINNYAPPKRVVSQAVKSRIVGLLKPHAGSCVAFASTQGDVEASDYKKQLIAVFSEAGWDVRDAETFMFFGSHKGFVMTIPFGASEEGLPQVIYQALKETGQPVSGNRGDMAKGCGAYIQVWAAP